MQETLLLKGFFAAIANDPRISITHIGVFACLLRYWEAQNFSVPLKGRPAAIKQLAKISSNTTYYRCMKDLSDFGYIQYLPSHKPCGCSKIYFLENRLVTKKSEVGNDERSNNNTSGFRPI